MLSTKGSLLLQEWMSALLNCLPAAQRARARLRMELNRMQARARGMGWSQLALVASLAIMVHSLESSALMHAILYADTLQALWLSYIASSASLALVLRYLTLCLICSYRRSRVWGVHQWHRHAPSGFSS